MPSRACNSFLHQCRRPLLCYRKECQCPLGLITHFYSWFSQVLARKNIVCQCPLGLITHFYSWIRYRLRSNGNVSMPSRAYNSFLQQLATKCPYVPETVSMPSRACNSFLQGMFKKQQKYLPLCQCPLGLVTHFYIQSI